MCVFEICLSFFSNRVNHNGASVICSHCLYAFSQQEICDQHLWYCCKQEAQQLDLPKSLENNLAFECLYKTLKVSYVICDDFESFVVPIETGTTMSTEPY